MATNAITGRRGAVAAAVLLAPLVAAPSAHPGSMTSMTVAAFGRRAPVVHAFRDLRIGGNVSLRLFAAHGLICHDCRFTGSVTGRALHFRGPLDLSGSTITGDLDVANTDFQGIVDLRGAQVLGRSDLAGADFHGLALFGVPPKHKDSFTGSATFALAHFDRLATFERGRFGSTANFSLVEFGGDAIFSKIHAEGTATFARATFGGLADFSDAQFNDAAFFTASSYAADADFGQASFVSTAVLDRTRFARGASFIGATFGGDSSFQSANARGGFDFALAQFYGSSNKFSYAVSTPATNFTSLTFGDGSVLLDFDSTSFDGLQMDAGTIVSHVSDSGLRYREHVLSVLESSSKTNGDLGRANAALYARQVLRSRHYRWFFRAPDYVFYRVGAGYFVRPLNPLTTLLAIVVAFALARTLRGTLTAPRAEVEASAHVHPNVESRKRPLWPRRLREFPGELWRTLASVAPSKGDAVPRVEVFAYRLLLACALIGFANSNPTLRQMFDAIH